MMYRSSSSSESTCLIASTGGVYATFLEYLHPDEAPAKLLHPLRFVIQSILMHDHPGRSTLLVRLKRNLRMSKLEEELRRALRKDSDFVVVLGRLRLQPTTVTRDVDYEARRKLVRACISIQQLCVEVNHLRPFPQSDRTLSIEALHDMQAQIVGETNSDHP
jgi:hypothetical protein